MVLDDQDRHGHRSRAPARRRATRPRRTHRHLPSRLPTPAKHGHPTTRQLLTHTAGLGNPLPIRWVRSEDQPEDPTLLNRILEKHGAPRRAVGDRAAYSNIGYLLAGAVIEAVTGRSVQDSIRDAVLEPLGMNETGYTYRAHAPRSIGYVRIQRRAGSGAPLGVT